MTRKAPSHRFFRAAVSLSLVGVLGACDMAGSVPQRSPFAAAESQPTGRRLDVWQGDALHMRMRLSMAGVRVYDETGIRLGRLLPAADGWLLQNRLGETLCEIPGETLGLVLRCGDRPAVELEYDALGQMSVQRNGESVAMIRFEAGQATMTLLAGPQEWTATEGSTGIELRTSGGELWRVEPPGLSVPAALSLAIPPQMSEEAGTARLERAAIVWMVQRALLAASHEGAGVTGEGSAREGSLPEVEGSTQPLQGSAPLLEGLTGVFEGSAVPNEGSGSALEFTGQSMAPFSVFGHEWGNPTEASGASAEGSTLTVVDSESPSEASGTPDIGSGSAMQRPGVIPE